MSSCALFCHPERQRRILKMTQLRHWACLFSFKYPRPIAVSLCHGPHPPRSGRRPGVLDPVFYACGSVARRTAKKCPHPSPSATPPPEGEGYTKTLYYSTVLLYIQRRQRTVPMSPSAFLSNLQPNCDSPPLPQKVQSYGGGLLMPVDTDDIPGEVL